VGMTNFTSTDPFFRYPRLVLGFTDDSQDTGDKLNLNLHGRFYVGFNERAEILEVISYNDEAGRFEYEVVRNYAAGKAPQVTYANRQLCLTCHQNQTPIFSAGPWLESNANPAMSDGLERVLNAKFYQGAPLEADITVPQSIDQTTRMANMFHAYHKMWQRLCSDMECRKDLLKQIFLYKMVGHTLLLTPELQSLDSRLNQRWAKEFPNGMSRPDSTIPNRDPLNDRGHQDVSVIAGKPAAVKSVLEQVLAIGDIPEEYEPARPRPPLLDVWRSAMNDSADGTGPGAVPRLVTGYAEFFTLSDAKLIDQLLIGTPATASEMLESSCDVAESIGTRTQGFTVHCAAGGNNQIEFTVFFRGKLDDGSASYEGTAGLLRVQPKTPLCDPSARATEANLESGVACPQYLNVPVRLERTAAGMSLGFAQASGLSLRLYDGRRISDAKFIVENKSAHLAFPVLDDLAPLGAALEAAYQSQETATKDNTEKLSGFRKYVDGPALNRGAVMAMILRFLGHPHDELITLTQNMRGLKRLTDAPENEITQVEGLTPKDRAMGLAMHNCGACHYNRDNEPPAYLGSPGETPSVGDKCNRLSLCTPRMLYRLKMWDCARTDWKAKKSPMPPEARFKTLGIDEAHWIATDRQALFQALLAIFPKTELPNLLIAKGVSPTDAKAITQELQTPGCEIRTSDIFEKLPDCHKAETTPQECTK